MTTDTAPTRSAEEAAMRKDTAKVLAMIRHAHGQIDGWALKAAFTRELKALIADLNRSQCLPTPPGAPQTKKQRRLLKQAKRSAERVEAEING